MVSDEADCLRLRAERDAADWAQHRQELEHQLAAKHEQLRDASKRMAALQHSLDSHALLLQAAKREVAKTEQLKTRVADLNHKLHVLLPEGSQLSEGTKALLAAGNVGEIRAQLERTVVREKELTEALSNVRRSEQQAWAARRAVEHNVTKLEAQLRKATKTRSLAEAARAEAEQSLREMRQENLRLLRRGKAADEDAGAGAGAAVRYGLLRVVAIYTRVDCRLKPPFLALSLSLSLSLSLFAAFFTNS